MHADDTHLYLSFRAQDYVCMADAKSSMELCVNDIKMWMQSHFLKQNELLLAHSKYRQMLALLPVLVGNEMGQGKLHCMEELKVHQSTLFSLIFAGS